MTRLPGLLVLLPLLLVGCAKHAVRDVAPPPPPPAPPVVMDAPMPMSIAAPAPAAGYAAAAPERSRTAPGQHGADDPAASVPKAEPQRVADAPISTFAVDVDTGSYTRIRQMLRNGRLPPPVAVRGEEFINYFDYGYPRPPSAEPPFSLTIELAPAPWHPQRHLLLVGLQGFEVAAERLPPANLVLLVDTSGSMATADKMPLVKAGLAALVERLRPQDRVAIVTYAGEAGLRLPSTPGSQRPAILAALDSLQAEGSTAGGAGIRLAYEVARANYIDGGINRVVLATDGDFNVGVRSIPALKSMVAEQRASGVALTTLGFGSNHYNDVLSEQLANVGNGNHAFIDDELEARRVLVGELTSTLFTIAKDVKVQLEFNPAQVAEYRLLGYTNRALQAEQFADDTVDAGEVGAGHSVTALYELVLVGSGGERLPRAAADTTLLPAELARLRLRYKPPQQDLSRAIEHALPASAIMSSASPRLRFAAAVAGFAEQLRGTPPASAFGWAELHALAADAIGAQPSPERAELLDLIELAATLAEAPLR